MTVTPLSSRIPHPTSPPGRPTPGRRRHAFTVGTPRLDTERSGADLTVSFEVRLSGESRYTDALEILDALRRVTDRLGTATLGVSPAPVVRGRGPAAAAETLPTPAPAPVPVEPVADGVVQIMPDFRSVVAGGRQITLTRVEFDLLVFLAEHPRQVFTRAQLLKNVWGYDYAGERTVDVHIRRLRAKLGAGIVFTSRRVGYGLSEAANATVIRLT